MKNIAIYPFLWEGGSTNFAWIFFLEVEDLCVFWDFLLRCVGRAGQEWERSFAKPYAKPIGRMWWEKEGKGEKTNRDWFYWFRTIELIYILLPVPTALKAYKLYNQSKALWSTSQAAQERGTHYKRRGIVYNTINCHPKPIHAWNRESIELSVLWEAFLVVLVELLYRGRFSQ